jgi:hypothetical protein
MLKIIPPQRNYQDTHVKNNPSEEEIIRTPMLKIIPPQG